MFNNDEELIYKIYEITLNTCMYFDKKIKELPDNYKDNATIKTAIATTVSALYRNYFHDREVIQTALTLPQVIIASVLRHAKNNEP